jgi:putative endonuclease
MDLFFVYIIYSSGLDKYYVGYTGNIQKRLIEHNTGISTYTSKSTDWELKWIKEFSSREEAGIEEKKIKSKKSRKYIEWLVSSGG